MQAALSMHPDMLYVPRGAFVRGRFGVDPFQVDKEPLREVVETDAFFVDRYEFPNRLGEKPTVDVNWDQAKETCSAIGKRLCTELEWERACKGPGSTIYAYGDAYQPTCSEMETTSYTIGGRARCFSVFGVFDLSGGVREWTSSPHPDLKNRMLVKGGSESVQPRGARCAFIWGEPKAEKRPTLGFRCCMDDDGAPIPLAGDAKTKRAISVYLSQVKACYEQRLKSTPELAGQVTLHMYIDGGRAANVEIRHNTTGDDGLASCVAARARSWRFPQDIEPHAEVVYPFVFSPGSGVEEAKGGNLDQPVP
jgi:hypothetical protein